MTNKILPSKSSLDKVLPLDDLYLPLGFKQHLFKSIVTPVLESGKPEAFSGIIFGPPGTGKTSVLKALAKEINWKIFELGPHDFVKQNLKIEETITKCFVEIREYVKKKAKSNTSKIAETIFVFDEIDALVV